MNAPPHPALTPLLLRARPDAAPGTDLHLHPVAVDKAARRRQSGHRSAALWLTGLSGAGKSTLANLLERELHALGHRSYLLDGDHLRTGLCRDLGFTPEARAENVRRAAEVAKLMVDAGLLTIVALISPFAAERRAARALFDDGEFIEVHVDVPLALAEARDPKGLYRKARRGELPLFTGIGSPYETPDAPELRIDTGRTTPAEAAAQLLDALRRRDLLLPSTERIDPCAPIPAATSSC